jgi:hypothetical protein
MHSVQAEFANKSILQEKTENAINFQMMRRNLFLANSLLYVCLQENPK